jgi:hypothetical protein
MGGVFSSPTPSAEETELKDTIEYRAIVKGIVNNDIPKFYYPIHQGVSPNRRTDDGTTLLELAINLQRVEVT